MALNINHLQMDMLIPAASTPRLGCHGAVHGPHPGAIKHKEEREIHFVLTILGASVIMNCTDKSWMEWERSFLCDV